MSSSVHIVLASDANYLPGLEVARATMCASCSAPERLVFHIFDDASLSNLQTSKLPNFPKWNGSLMPYLRLWLPELLKDVEWVIYSDVDTIWNRDICELWETTVAANYQLPTAGSLPSVYWVRDLASMRGEANGWISKVAAGEGHAFDWSRYACSGVCVLNLKKMREMNFTQRVLDLYAKYGVPKFPDQDVLNILFNRDSAFLPSVWNAMGDCSNLPRTGERCVYHLTGVGRHFHDKTPPTYPPQYVLWWRVFEMVRKGVKGDESEKIAYRLLAILWPLHGLANLLPLRLRERIVRQWFFARGVIFSSDIQ